jgi:hypothetical protein
MYCLTAHVYELKSCFMYVKMEFTKQCATYLQFIINYIYWNFVAKPRCSAEHHLGNTDIENWWDSLGDGIGPSPGLYL